jgi:hypothetical protein
MPPRDKKKKTTNQQASSEISRRLSNISPSFSMGRDRKYPYLSSKFSLNKPNIQDPFARRGPDQRTYRYSTNDASGTSRVGQDTHALERKYKQDQALKGKYITDMRAVRKPAEKQAKISAKFTGDYKKGIYQASKLLAQGKESEADSMMANLKSTAYKAHAYGRPEAGGPKMNKQVVAEQFRTLDKLSSAYYSPRIRQQAKNMTKGVQMSSAKITAPDPKEINASLRSLTSRKKK